MKWNQHIFREYDIRGTVNRDLSEEFAYSLGRGFAQYVRKHGDGELESRPIGVGFDCRLSSPGYAKALARGIAAEGIAAEITGLGPTPQLYFASRQRSYAGGIQVTGSHNPPDMNGFKMCIGKRTLSGADIQELRLLVEGLSSLPSSREAAAVTEQPVRDEYIAMLVENCRSHMGERKLKVVCDAGNGVGGLVGPKVLRDLGVEVIELFCDPDGNFPNHHPDPTELKNIQHLVAKVREVGADFGIGWDGDADRIGVVDEKGEIIFGDMLLLIYGRALLEEVPGATIIGDVKCSSRLFEDLAERGANAIMWKTGHSLIKGKLAETSGHLAGEMSGHMFFGHRYFGFDDALYASCRFAEIVSKTTKKVSELISDLPKVVTTPEIRVDCDEDKKFKIVEKLKGEFSGYNVNTIDGVRVTFDSGWGLVRASNTQPVLVMRFEAASEALLETYRNQVVEKVEKVKRSL